MTTRTAFDGTEMVLQQSRACRECIARFIGPALATIGEPTDTPRDENGRPVGCCHREATRYTFTYWFPWPENA